MTEVPLSAAAAVTILGLREVLAKDTTYTVGSGQDHATLQAAWDFVCKGLDLNGFDVTFDFSGGTHGDVSDEATR